MDLVKQFFDRDEYPAFPHVKQRRLYELNWLIPRLKAKRVPCMLFDYRQIDLQPNVHYVQPDGTVTRASEFMTGQGERREFPALAREDIVRFVQEGQMVPSGATWHTPPCSVVRLRVPLAGLVDGSMTPDQFTAFVLDNEAKGNIRYLQRSVYACDEWQ